MNNRNPESLCRVSEELRAKEFADEQAELRQVEIDRRATEIAEQVQGYRHGRFAMDFSDFRNTMSNDEYMDFCDTFFAILYGNVEPGITDTRPMDARAYSDKRIEKWAEVEARKEME